MRACETVKPRGLNRSARRGSAPRYWPSGRGERRRLRGVLPHRNAGNRRRMSRAEPRASAPAHDPDDIARRGRRHSAIAAAASAARAVPCQRKCSRPIPEIASRCGAESQFVMESVIGGSFHIRRACGAISSISSRRGLTPGQRVHHQLARRSLEYPLQHVPGELALGLLGGQACFIDVRPLGFVSPHRAFCRHNLQQLQDRGVSQGFLLAQGLMHFTHGRGAAGPQNAENFELRSGGFCGGCFMERDITTKTFVVSTKIFVDAMLP